MAFLLILIYSNSMIIAEPKQDEAQCLQEASDRNGKEFRPVYWDNMGTSLPKVIIAFCTKGFGT